jgi:hypothetical protein
VGDVISPINGFDVPESPAPRHFDVKCFTYTKGYASSDSNEKSLPKSSSVDSGDGSKVVHLLGYSLSHSSSNSEAV